jgi:hypothetical protein
VCVDLVGKRKRIRTVPILPFVKVAIDAGTRRPVYRRAPCFGGFAGEKAPVRILAKARRVPS